MVPMRTEAMNRIVRSKLAFGPVRRSLQLETTKMLPRLEFPGSRDSSVGGGGCFFGRMGEAKYGELRLNREGSELTSVRVIGMMPRPGGWRCPVAKIIAKSSRFGWTRRSAAQGVMQTPIFWPKSEPNLHWKDSPPP